MHVPRNILVPTDFSEGANVALAYAVELASSIDARIHLLNVISFPSLGTLELGAALSPGVLEDIESGNRHELERLAAHYQHRCPFGPGRLEVGDPRTVIDEMAEVIDADLIIMGTHGRRGLSRMLLGSVAESVVRSAPCPVLTVRPGKT